MTVIQLESFYSNENPWFLFKYLETYFPKTKAEDIYHYLIMHGLDSNFPNEGKDFFQQLNKTKLLKRVEEEVNHLQKLWDGPDVPIFILPIDAEHPVWKNQKEKSGLAFQDKLFLFIHEKLDWNEIKALLTHEYNHVCRLKHYKKAVETYSLLDAVVLEGLAEWAVLQYVGKDFVGHWLNIYSEEELSNLWRTYISPNQDVKRDQPLYESLLYGQGKYPPMAGYCTGWFLVNIFVQRSPLSMKELLQVPSIEFVF